MLTFEQTDGGVVLYDNGAVIAAFEPNLNAHPIYDIENNKQLVMLTKSVNPANSRDSYTFDWKNVDLVGCIPPIVAPNFNTFVKELRNFFKRASSGDVGGTVTWSNVTGKPSTFPPSTHSHVFNDLPDVNALSVLGNNTASPAKTIQITIDQLKTLIGQATETDAGIAEILSTTEAQLGSDDTRIATILKVSQWFDFVYGDYIDDGDNFTRTLQVRDSLNLIVNAIDYNLNDGMVLRSNKTGAGGGSAVLSVDGTTGISISQFGLAHLWFDHINAEVKFLDLRTNKKGIEYDFTDYANLTANSLITKNFAELLLQGVKTKDPVLILSSSALTLLGIQTIQTIVGFDGARIGVKDNTTANGIYIMRAGAWERAPDADNATELISATFLVEQGTYANETWRVVTNTITLGSTNIVISRVAGAGAIAWGGITGSLPSQTDLQNALNLKANLASPTFTGIVIAPLLDTAKGTDLASAGTVSIGTATGNYIHITGTTTITSLGTGTAGMFRTVRFAGILTLTHNATSLILPTNANIATVGNDVAVFVSEGGSNWRCVAYQRTSGAPLFFTNNSIDNTKLSTVATGTIRGRITAATGNIENLTPAQAKTVLAITQADVSGLVTALGLKADTTYVDLLVQGIKTKAPVALLVNTNLTLSGLQNLQAIIGVVGLRLALTGQTVTTENGLYAMQSGAWTRTTDADIASELISATFLVEGGTFANTTWRVSTNPITLGSTNITIVQVQGAIAVATESSAGIVELISNAEAIVGTDNVRVPTILRVSEWFNAIWATKLNNVIPDTFTSFPGTITFEKSKTYFTKTLPTALAVPAKSLTGAVEGNWVQIFHQDTGGSAIEPDLGNYSMYGGYVLGLVNRIVYFIAGGEIQMAIDQTQVPLTAIATGIVSEFPQFPYLYQGGRFNPIFTTTTGKFNNIIWRKYADVAKASPTQLQALTYFERAGVHDITVELCAIINITLSGSPTIDGISSSGRTVLLNAQTNRAQNGVYQNTAGVWTRLASMDSGTEYNGKRIYISGGTLEKGKSFRSRYLYPAITYGTTELIFDEITFEKIIASNDTAFIGYEVQVRNGLGQQANSELVTPIIHKTTSDVILGAKTASNGTITTESSGVTGTANDIDVVSVTAGGASANCQLTFASSVVDEQFHFINGFVWVEGISVLTVTTKLVIRVNGGNVMEVHANGERRYTSEVASVECAIMDNAVSPHPTSLPFVQSRWIPVRIHIRKTDITGSVSLAFRLEGDLVTTTTKLKVLLFDEATPANVRRIKLMQI